MILKRYGETLHSVELNFDSKALTEIGFKRDRSFSLPAEELASAYAPSDTHELSAKTEGWVQDEVEQQLLQDLERQVAEVQKNAGADELLVIESEQGIDYPKTRTEQKTLVVEGENKLYFYVRIEPPLRIGRYRKRS
jgi:hypothetical protein